MNSCMNRKTQVIIKQLPNKESTKREVFRVHSVKAQMGRGGGVYVQLNSLITSALDGRKWSNSRPGRFTPRKEPRFPLNRWLDRPQSRSGRFGEEKISCSAGIRTPDFPERS